MRTFLAGVLIAALLGGGMAVALTFVQLDTADVGSTGYVRL